MLMRAHLVHKICFLVCKIEIPEQCNIVCFKGSLFVRRDDVRWLYDYVDHLLLDGIDPDTICVIENKDYEREAA